MTGLSLTLEDPVTFRYGKWNMARFGDTSKFGLERRLFARYQKARSTFLKVESHLTLINTKNNRDYRTVG
jgi:hypothetical protein